MSFFTVFFGILIVALLAGNALLSLVSEKRQQKQSPSPQKNSSFSYPSVQEPTTLIEVPPSSETSISDKVLLIDARLTVLNNKILMAHERLQRIEAMLLQSLNQGISPQFGSSVDATVVSNRVEKLMNFKSNAEIELAAIKDALRSAGIMKPLEKDSQKSSFDDAMRKKFRAATRDLSDMERKAHELVYHAAKK